RLSVDEPFTSMRRIVVEAGALPVFMTLMWLFHPSVLRANAGRYTVLAGVGVGGSWAAAATARAAFTRPAPRPESPIGSAVERRMASTSGIEYSGWSERSSAITPVTWGAAIDVPVSVR